MAKQSSSNKIVDLTHFKELGIWDYENEYALECRVYDATDNWEISGEPFVNNLTLALQDGLLGYLSGKGFNRDEIERYIYCFIVECLNGDQAARLKTSGEITPSNFPINIRTENEVLRVLNKKDCTEMNYKEEITVA